MRMGAELRGHVLCLWIAYGLVLAAMLGPASLVGQSTYTAQLTGVVTDSSGGVIAGCRVTLTDEGTGVASTATTDARGTGAAVGWDAT
jgi:hypothetical protein